MADHLPLLLVLEEVLGDDGYRVVSSLSAEGAARFVAQERVDVIVGDSRLPDVRRLGLAARAEQRSRPIPVILISADGRDDAPPEVRETARVAVLPGPLSSRGLIEAIQSVLSS